MDIKKQTLIKAKIVTLKGVYKKGAVEINNGKIEKVYESAPVSYSGKILDYTSSYLVAGFIDTHCHGGGGYDCIRGKYDSKKKGFVLSDTIFDEALVSATDIFSRVPAEAYSIPHTGVIEEGKDADLAVINIKDAGNKKEIEIVKTIVRGAI